MQAHLEKFLPIIFSISVYYNSDKSKSMPIAKVKTLDYSSTMLFEYEKNIIFF